MDSSIPNRSSSSAKSITLNDEMDSSNEDFDQQVLRDAGEQTISAEWSATVSALNSSDTTSSNSYINIETLKECCANSSYTLKDKEDFMVFESSSTVINISKCNANDTKYYSERKTTAFQKKPKPFSQNFSRCFENILDDDSQMEITQSSICLNRFQKRKRLMPPNEEFIEINNSNYSSGLDSVEVSMMKSPKFCFSRKKKDQFDIPDYNLSATDSVSIADDTNISKRKENTSNLSLVVNDSSNTMKNVSKTEVFPHKFSLRTIGIVDSVFDNIINNSSMVSDITLNNKNTSLNETSLSNVNNSSVFSKMDISNLNHTYDIPNNTNSTKVKALIAGNNDVPKVKQNTVFKKPSNLSILTNDSSSNIMDVSKTEVFPQKFSRKSIGIADSAFDNIINNSSITSNIALNNKKTSLNETSVSNVNNIPMFGKIDMSNLNHTYDIPTIINTSTTNVSIADDTNMPKVDQNTDFIKPSNVSIITNDSSNNIMDVSKTEVFPKKFSRKSIGIADSAFDNIINDSSIESDNVLNYKNTSSNDNNIPMFGKIDMSNLNHTYDIPTIINTSTTNVSIAGDTNMNKVNQNTDFIKPSISSFVVNNTSNNMDVSKTEVFTHKFSRKTIDITDSIFENIINDSSMLSDIALNDKKVSLIETSVSNVNNTPVFSTMDISNLNHTYDVPINNNSTLLDDIVENDKSMSETHVLHEYSGSKSFNLRPFKFNFSRSRNKSTSSKHSTSVIENNDSLTSLNATTEISIGGKSSRNQSKRSTSAISNSDSLTLSNTTIESLKSNESQKTQSKCSISPTSYNEGLTLTNSTTELSGRRSSSRNKSTSSKHSTSVIENNESLTSLNATTEISVGGRSSRNQSKRSTSDISNTDSLTLLNTTIESLKSNESQKTQSKRSISPTSYNEDLTLTNSTTELSGRRSSSRNKSTSSKHSTSDISNTDSLTLLNTTLESLKSNKSQKTQSKRSISPTSNNEGLTLTNSTTELPGRRSSSRNKSTSSKHSTSVIENNESLTSLNTITEISVGGRSSRNHSKHSTSDISNTDSLTLLNTTIESLKSNESQKTQSKRSISPTSYNEGLTLTNSTTELSGRRSSSRNKSSSSQHSTSVIENNESLTSLNAITEISVGGRSSRNQSKRSTSDISNTDSLTLLNTSMESLKSNESQKTQSKRSISPTSYNEGLTSTNSTTKLSGRRSSSRNKSKSSKHSTSVIENNDSLTLLNTSMESLKSNKSMKMQSKCSIIPTSYNEGFKSTNSITGISGRRISSRNKSSILTSKHSTSVISNNDNLTSLNATTETSVGGRSTRNQSKHSTSVISNNDSLTLLNSTMESSENIKSQKTQLKGASSPTLTTLNTTTGSLKQNVLSINEPTSKYSSSIISRKTSTNALIFEDVINNVSRMSTRSLKQKSNNLDNVEPVTSIITDELSNSDVISINNTTTGSLEQTIMSINQSNCSPNISTKTSTNGLILEDDINYVSKTQPSLSKQKNISYDNIEQIMPNKTDGSLVENRPSTTKVLRSSLRIKKKKSENNEKNGSGSTRTSKNMVNFNNESFGNNSDNSLFWTTLPDESTNISSIQNVNTFQTPKINKLTIAENIVNTIKIMSTNQKSTHPGAFELNDHENKPLTRSYVTRSFNRSPSILTLVFGGQNSSESTSSLTKSLSEINIDQLQVEENVNQKFKSLYKKEFWITKRLYKFLIFKLQPNYNIYSVKYAEKFVKYLAQLFKKISSDQVNLQLCTDMLRYHMARYQIIKDTFDYLGFLTDYIPMAYFKKLVPGWNLETSAVKFDPQKYYIPLMEDEEFLNYIMEQLNEA